MGSYKVQRRVLVVDDVINNYTYLMAVLMKYGCEVLYAENGAEAVEQFIKNKAIDIIFMDINLPIMDGFEATMKIRELDEDVPVIAVTAYSSGEYRKKASKAGCNEYLTKPFFSNQIETILKKYPVKMINLNNNNLGDSNYLRAQ